MEKNHYGIALDQVKLLNQLLLIGFIASLLSSIILGLCLYRAIGTKTITFVPPVMTQQSSISAVRPDDAYLEMMSLYYLGLKLNVNPSNVHYYHQLLLIYADPSDYSHIYKILDNEEQAIVKEKISSVFYPDEVTVNPETLTVRVAGKLVKTVGVRPLKPHYYIYEIPYSYDNGLLKFKDMYRIEKQED